MPRRCRPMRGADDRVVVRTPGLHRERFHSIVIHHWVLLPFTAQSRHPRCATESSLALPANPLLYYIVYINCCCCYLYTHIIVHISSAHCIVHTRAALACSQLLQIPLLTPLPVLLRAAPRTGVSTLSSRLSCDTYRCSCDSRSCSEASVQVISSYSIHYSETTDVTICCRIYLESEWIAPMCSASLALSVGPGTVITGKLSYDYMLGDCLVYVHHGMF